MKRCTKCNIEKDLNEFHKSKDKKDGLETICKACVKIYQKEYNLKNKDIISKKRKIYYQDNKEVISKNKKEYGNNNKESIAKVKKIYRQENKVQIAINKKEYAKANPDKCNAYNAKRRASKLQCTVSWADLNLIKQVYSDCVEINLAAKVAGCTETFVVDHIIPLQGKNVSGLHVHNNLQVITASENCSKSNSFTPGRV